MNEAETLINCHFSSLGSSRQFRVDAIRKPNHSTGMRTASWKTTQSEPNNADLTPKEIVPAEWFTEVRARAAERMQGHCIENTDPEKAAKILWMLSQGVPKLRISNELGVRRETITRLGWTHKDTLETKRKEFSREFAITAELYKDLLIEKFERLAKDPEKLDAISPDKLAVAMGILADKSAQLAGMAGVIIEHRKGVSIDDAMKFQAEIRARIAEKMKAQAIVAEIVIAGDESRCGAIAGAEQ